MEEMYGLHPTAPDYSPENLIWPSDYRAVMIINSAFPESHWLPVFRSDDELISAVSGDPPYDQDSSSTAIKAKIAAHPGYPRLLKSYIDCYKVVAPPEMGQVLEEIRRKSDMRRRQQAGDTLGVDPELDEFMDTYCEVLDQYKFDLSRPFDEAKTFLSEIETKLRDLCNGDFVTTSSEEGAVSSDEECGEELDVKDLQQKDEERDLKDQLLRRFGSHISSLRLEFSKKKKKGKLPKEATRTLSEWWRAHCKWPYPTEADKIALAETTALDQRQINNWFINQRKRHWKPSEDLQLALMDNLSRQYLTNDT
ncbi:hypothetical protein Cgig2_018256 [Carnegiea gigantea]|uniref:Homeobox protein knotted-1-like 6 n=1 Tax=Carnegiea gigantea TaxID=171969 RepID=A0A9Q1L000_9CARY|nr:hypothetical protein Cgig2_018256 [Carnegiea gigantea]